MAADVSCLVRVHGGYNKDDHDSEKSTALITRDLLGGSPAKLVSDAQELDLDLQVPCGWEKRLDLKSGKVYLQRCSAQNSISDNPIPNKANHTTFVPKLQQDFNMNFPNNNFFSTSATTTTMTRTALNLFDDTSLDLKLVSSSSSSPPPNSSSPSGIYQSVCTLDKVKSALERAEKEPSSKRRSSTTTTTTWKSSSPSYSSSSSSMKEDDNNDHYQYQHQHRHQRQHNNDDSNNHKVILQSSPFAAGCPGCLSYVLIMKNNPKCPRCNTSIPLPLVKKPRIDLNMTI